MKGQVIGGKFSEILIRQKTNQELELGELLISENKQGKILLQVYDLEFGSQLSKQNLELISGLSLEEDIDLEVPNFKLKNYNLAIGKAVLNLKNGVAKISKTLPDLFSTVREVTNEDLKFLVKPENPLFFGNLRSGSKTLQVPVYLDGEKTLTHHLLIAGTTGKGKSNLMSNLLWDATSKDYCSLLVLDPHDEYYGRNSLGLKDHSKKCSYYSSKNVPTGGYSLVINTSLIKPEHFSGVVNFSDAQNQTLYAYYKKYGIEWVEALLIEKPIEGLNLNENTINVLKRRLMHLLDVEIINGILKFRGIFQVNSGKNTISEIVKELEDGKTVIINTSNFSSSIELLIGSLIANEIFSRYKYYKITGELNNKPVVSIILEEAPRVLGKQVLEQGGNIFSTIAREGRKFKTGLIAITQLPSLIPREILANMNTKIILGIEMNNERQAIIDSSAQDLSKDSRSIASLDLGECIVTSNFARFATPVKIPLFKEFANISITNKKLNIMGLK